MSSCGIGLEIYSLTPRLQQRGQQWFCPHQLESFWDDSASSTEDSAVQDASSFPSDFIFSKVDNAFLISDWVILTNTDMM